jgi:hypothetical protein
LVESDSAVEGGAKVVEGVDFLNDLDRGVLVMVQGRPARWRRMGVSWKTSTLHFSYARRRRLFSHQVCVRLLHKGEELSPR